MKINTQTIIISVVGVLLIGGAYLYFFPATPAQSPLSATTPASADEQQFLSLAGELDTVSFDSSIFTDPRFNSLVDLTIQVTPEPLGRSDPFAPLPGLAGAKQ